MTGVSTPMPLPGTWDDFVLGGHHYCGHAGGVWSCWGWNAAGQLGIGTATTHNEGPTVPICTQGT
jgi:alpha-tubulin suppressor-like RCC1 family protein